MAGYGLPNTSVRPSTRSSRYAAARSRCQNRLQRSSRTAADPIVSANAATIAIGAMSCGRHDVSEPARPPIEIHNRAAKQTYRPWVRSGRAEVESPRGDQQQAGQREREQPDPGCRIARAAPESPHAQPETGRHGDEAQTGERPGSPT